MVGISRPVVKHSFLVKQTEDIPGVLKKAFWLAASGRPRSGSGRSAEGYSQSGEEAALRLAGRSEHALV
ncbi:acetolactate synthase 3 catalytic subunit [Klebsiella pneumoniae]|uniref:Acetolactate synthase 3 catalytic subunit n=1 Tax=Klebsiella pneumoniae TaxID=573 RepID=A0A447RZH9_KLEPN|nr:acetolactate synthase 3 catalytic subunit [Klebsiella pneumoniae]